MRKYFFVTAIILLFTLAAKAQMPQLTVDGKTNNGVALQRLKIEIKVCGTVARTTWQMTFKNNTSQILEGTLNFPLKDGLSVSRYALDINGKMREAVPVDRAKGTEVFEAIERRRVDPGLLEKVDGNTFRTRIYPINPNSTRTVLIGYEEELPLTANAALHYYLPLNLKEKIAEFSLDVSVIQSALAPVFDSAIGENMQFANRNNLYIASVNKNNYTPDHSLSFSIPKPADAAEVMLQEFENKYYYLINTMLQPNEREKVLPTSIGLLWDASLSGSNRNTNKEMELLDAYFKKINNASVNLVVFSNSIKNTKQFFIRQGNWSELKETLTAIRYDGSTNLGNLNLKNIQADEFILISDGHQTLGNRQMQLGNKPVYCITTAVSADYSNLKFIAGKTAGLIIDLQHMNVPDAIKALTHEQFRFLGIEQNRFVKENYPSIPVAVNKNFAASGIATEGLEKIVLQFGYAGTVTYEKVITINTETQLCENFDITKVFAQKKIAELDIQYDQNKREIESVGRQFGVVTRNTSLIVLETINDYVSYEIESPAELRPEYERIMKQRSGDIITKTRNELQNSMNMMTVLKAWYNKESVNNEKVKTEPAVIRTTAPEQTQPVVSTSPPAGSKVISGTVTDIDGNPISFASIRIKGKREGVSADANGRYSLRIRQGDVLAISGASFKTTEVPVGAQNVLNTVLETGGTTELKEVVVTGAYGIKRTARSTSSNVQNLTDDQVNEIRQTNVNNALAGKTAGAEVRNQSIFKSGAETTVRLRGENGFGLPKDGSFNLDSVYRKLGEQIAVENKPVEPPFDINAFDYIRAIKQTEKINRYLKYLELRQYYISKPTYFFEVATYLLKTGDKDNGLTVLSNLAELENGNYELYKMLGYKLKESGDHEGELAAFKKVLELRPSDPQSYRDCALAHADLGNYQDALDMLYAGMTKSYSAEMNRMYYGIEEIFLTEINHLIGPHKNELDLKNIDKKLIALMPADIRVVMNWNKNNSDIDLWVTDPNGEKCSYSNKTTQIGGRISNDFTQGFGPEQFLLKSGIKGKYKIQINYYSDRQVTISGPTTVMAEIYLYYGTSKEEKRIVTLQMEKGKQGEIFIGEVEL